MECDNEFKSTMNKIKDDLDVDMNFTSENEHVPEAERNNRTIKERMRAAIQRLPFGAIPKVMIRWLAMVVTHQLNLFPVKGGISSHYSPHVIMSNTDWDYKKHCQVPFGGYVQAINEPDPSNTMTARTIDAIYLRPLRNIQGGHEVMDLTTGRVITRRKVTEIPMTTSVIKRVETMAADQGITNIKFANRLNVELRPADLIAGVDYENENEDEDEEEDDEDYEEESESDEDEELEEVDEEDDPAEIEERLAS